MITRLSHSVSTALSPVELFRVSLERLGWNVTSVDIDLVRGTARIELRRGDRLVTFDARNGRATTTRERIRRTLATVGRRGDVTVVERLQLEFVGRERHEGIRSGLRWLANYVGDNATRPALRGEARAAFRLILNANVVGGGAL